MLKIIKTVCLRRALYGDLRKPRGQPRLKLLAVRCQELEAKFDSKLEAKKKPAS
jgi:hypothetical protein